jgi:Fe2+ transport system protein FeoA
MSRPLNRPRTEPRTGTAPSRSLNHPLPTHTLRAVSETAETCLVLDGQCAEPGLCPLSEIKAGAVVCVKRLNSSHDVKVRLRELGLREEQRIRLVSRQSSYICQVCNARLGISERLAEQVMVQPVPAKSAA